jgi:DNA-binding winged helix-turn-helix (wHTH) protein
LIYRFGNFELDEASFELRRAGDAVSVQPKVLDVLAYLVRHKGRLITKEELFGCLWPGVTVSDASLARAIMGARRALGDAGSNPRWIVTMRGRGYRFIGERTEENHDAVMKRSCSGYAELGTQS